MIYTTTRLEDLRDIVHKAQELIERIETNGDKVEEEFIFRFNCEFYPLGKREDRTVIELYETVLTRDKGDVLIRQSRGIFRGIK